MMSAGLLFADKLKLVAINEYPEPS
jgi:hypothetical protein